MILSDKTLINYLKSGKIEITPIVSQEDIRPAGIRVHLSDEILIPIPGQTVDLQNPSDLEYERLSIRDESYTLEPGGFILAATKEKIKTSRDILTVLDGRSTIARLGLTTHITAGVLDGTMYTPQSPVLEIKNVGVFNIKLRYDDPIALVCFHTLSEKVVQEELPKYTAQEKVQVPALVKDWEKDK